MAPQKTGSELQSDSKMGVYSKQDSTTYFWRQNVCKTLDDHEGSGIIKGRRNTNYRFADDSVVDQSKKKRDMFVSVKFQL